MTEQPAAPAEPREEKQGRGFSLPSAYARWPLIAALAVLVVIVLGVGAAVS